MTATAPTTPLPARPGGRTEASLYAATIAMGLSAGLYFAFDVSVMPGLDRTDDAAFASAMGHINDAIENGFFGLVFFGAFLATGVSGVSLRRLGHIRAARWTWAALALYSAAVAVTMKVNIPLNRQLARLTAEASGPEIALIRDRFRGAWTPANAARTLACTAALACLGRALTLRARG
ncbi:anthrone oxygenase family protein [Streptomyces sp. NPDC016469]|uniref:anthrone oxygenase family protein n=1 Tax=Streptomyces sp. NPDC016469 TaxID=3157191 RepID=UPI0034046C7D